MRERVINHGSTWILFDRDAWDGRSPALFERGAGRVPVSGGRGDAWFLQHRQRSYVVRHYRRGGAVEALLSDRYLWTGLDATRAFREWRLLAMLAADGLPVPRPVAARVRRSGPVYRADLVTFALPGVRSLADRLAGARLNDAAWRSVGACIRLFHDRGVWHADLNAYNILLAEDDRPYLIDFDKSRIRRVGGHWKGANLARLRRSLGKLALRSPEFGYSEENFSVLVDGYSDTPQRR